jgi:hypothetical protein
LKPQYRKNKQINKQTKDLVIFTGI